MWLSVKILLAMLIHCTADPTAAVADGAASTATSTITQVINSTPQFILINTSGGIITQPLCKKENTANVISFHDIM